MANILGYYNNEKIKVQETEDDNLNMPIVFVKNANTRNQNLLIDGVPNELYYNPSSKTLFVDNIETKIANLQEGEAILIDNSVDNKTTVNVNFSKNTDVITSIQDTDTLLISNNNNALKTITGANLKSDIRLTAGTNLSYGSGSDSNKLSLDSTIENVALDSGCSWNGNLILAPKLSNGAVSDAEFQKLNGVSSAILQVNMKGADNGVCELDGNGFVPVENIPGSIDDIRNFADVAAFPEIGENPPPEAGIIYVALDTKKSYRWNGLASGANNVVYTEITNGLVIGTGASNAFAGNLGAANTAAISAKQPILTASTTSGILMNASDNIEIDMTRTTVETTFDDNELMLIQKTNGNVCRLTKQQLKSSINTNTEYAFAGPNLATSGTNISLNPTLAGLTSVSIRNDNSECLLLKTQNSSFLKECSITMSKNNTNNQTNFGIRFDGLNLKFGSVNNVLNGTLTEYMRLSSTELLIAGNAHLTTGHNFKIANSIICQTTKPNTGVTLTGGVVRMDIASCAASSGFVGTDIFILQTNANPAVSKRITGAQLISGINGFAFASPNLLTAANGTDISLNTTLASLVALTATSNNLDIKTTTNNDIIFSQNNNSIMKISSDGITALNSKQFFGSFSGGANNLILETGLSSGVATNIIFKTNEVQRALISSTKLDLEVDVDLASGKSYKINGTAINKSTVGLGNVDNTSDASKPISTATQSALTAINASNIVYKTGTQSIGGVKTFTSKVNIQAPSGYAKLEIGGPSGVLIDLKKPFSDDFDLRIEVNDNCNIKSNKSLILSSSNTIALTLDTSQNATFAANLQSLGVLNVPTISGTSFISTIHTAKIGCVFANNFAGIRHKDANNTTGYALIQGGDGSTYVNSAGTKPLRFRIANVTKMEISALGKVGIGKTPTARDLDVLGPISSDDAFQLNGVDVVRNEGLSEGTNVWVNCRLLQNRSALSQDGMYINYDSTGTSNLRLYAGGTNKRMELFTNGKVAINIATPTEILHVGGNIRASGYIILGGIRAGFSGGITYNSLSGPGSANQIGFKWSSPNIYGRVDNVLSMVVGTASDRRIKRNIKNITEDESRKFLDLIQPRSYNSAKYVVDGIEISCDCNEIIYGGVAQEIEENFPSLVLSEGEDGLKSLYNDQISFLTLSSLQMVDKTVTELKKENEELKDKVNELELKLNLIMEKLNI